MILNEPPDTDLFQRLKSVASQMPPASEMERLLLNLDNPAHDDASKDRYVALVCGTAVEEALKVGLARFMGRTPDDPIFDKALGRFSSRIRKALDLKLISSDEAVELERIRTVRNAFAHAVASLSFDTSEVQQITRSLWHHPVSSWAGYMAPTFAPRHQFAIVCGEFYLSLSTRAIQTQAGEAGG